MAAAHGVLHTAAAMERADDVPPTDPDNVLFAGCADCDDDSERELLLHASDTTFVPPDAAPPHAMLMGCPSGVQSELLEPPRSC